MADYRPVHTSFWEDTWIEELEPLQRYNYLYYMTNSRTTYCGIYEISKRKIAKDTGLSPKQIDENLAFFAEEGKLIYSESTRELMLLNWIKFNMPISPKNKIGVNRELMVVKNKTLVNRYYGLCEKYGCSMDRVCSSEEESPDSLTEDEIPGDTPVDEVMPTPDQPDTPPPPKQQPVPFDTVFQLYQDNCPSLPRIQIKSEKRKKVIKSRYTAFPDIEIFRSVFEKVEKSKFLTGKIPGKEWKADFDWIMEEANFIKIYEGKYDNNQPTQDRTRGW